MRAKSLVSLALLLTTQAGQALACSVCFSAPASKTTHSMAIAIWFLMAAVMSVLGGISAFGFHLWRHSRMPLEPHQELTDEDLNLYD
ncbi:MAG: hypothetical protein H0X73_04495 [Chthoniobacterales bacterium]|nr:hypothetical protein [Chthoniobacterales bacterium]